MSDRTDTYVVLRYSDEFSPSRAGYSSRNCNWDLFGGDAWLQSVDTNTGYVGKYIFKVSEKVCLTSGRFTNVYILIQKTRDLTFSSFPQYLQSQKAILLKSVYFLFFN